MMKDLTGINDKPSVIHFLSKKADGVIAEGTAR